MKRKFFIGGAALLFAAATLFNMSFLTGNNAGDVSMQSIAIMAKAQPESGDSDCPSSPNSHCQDDATGKAYCQHVSEPDHGPCS